MDAAPETQVVLAQLRLRPERRDDFHRLIARLTAEITRIGSGDMSYEALQNSADPLSVALIGRFRDKNALALHVASDLYETTMPSLLGCLAQPPEVKEYGMLA
jgi:quinol monooxygenase YgiN